MAGNQGVTTENINEVILRLLKLKSGMEMDYQTYAKKIKIKLASSRMTGKFIPAEEDKLLRDEFKRVRNKEGRFIIPKKKTTKVSSPPPSRPPGGDGGFPPKTGFIVKSSPAKLSTEKFLSKPKVEKVNVRDITEKTAKVSRTKDNDILGKINQRLDSILETLNNIYNYERGETERRRRTSERDRRTTRERELESKPFEGIKKAISTITKPFQSIWDTIVNFITNVILGRIVLKLINWFGDPKNESKIQSIIRFFGDHWPKLLALYLRFGTGLGRFIGKLTGILIKGSIELVKRTASLAARFGLKGAGKFASFLGGPKGKLLGAGLTIGANVAGMMATTNIIENFAGGGKDKNNPEDLKEPDTSGGVPAFSGGGWNTGFKNFFGNVFSGLVKGPGGPKSDKVPAMLSNGEFVMSAGAVQKYGVDTLESMNAAGGGTNIPQIASGILHAAGGGFVGDVGTAQDAWINYLNSPAGENYKRGGKYYDPDPFKSNELISKHNREFVKKYVKTGQPPEWAKVSQKTTKVNTSPRSTTPRPSQTPPPRSTPPNTSSSLSKPTSALSTNVRSPGARIPRAGSLSAIMMALEMKQRKDEGQTNVQAGLGAGASALGGQLGWMGGAKAGAIAGAALGSIVPGLGTAAGAGIGAIAGGLIGGYGGAMAGGKIADDFSGVNAKKERATRGVGGDIVGGYGLKGQSFKDAPKTSIITDDKGRPYVGHKALKNGKLTYVRSSAPGTGTTNPLEMLGRFINPGAYKQNDAKIGMKNQKIAMVNALESMQKQGMAPDAQARMMKQMGGNLKDVQNDLNYRKNTQEKIKGGELKPNGTRYTSQERMRMSISRSQTRKSSVKPLPRATSRPQVAGGGMGGRRGGGANPSTQGTKPPSFSPNHSSRSTRTARSTLGINSKI
jgi:hypothetical protein